MGKGDKRTQRGKIYRGSHGKTRPHKLGKGTSDAKTAKTAKTSTRTTGPRPLRPLAS